MREIDLVTVEMTAGRMKRKGYERERKEIEGMATGGVVTTGEGKDSERGIGGEVGKIEIGEVAIMMTTESAGGSEKMIEVDVENEKDRICRDDDGVENVTKNLTRRQTKETVIFDILMTKDLQVMFQRRETEKEARRAVMLMKVQEGKRQSVTSQRMTEKAPEVPTLQIQNLRHLKARLKKAKRKWNERQSAASTQQPQRCNSLSVHSSCLLWAFACLESLKSQFASAYNSSCYNAQ